MGSKSINSNIASLLARMGHRSSAGRVRKMVGSFYATWQKQELKITYLRGFTKGLYYDAKFLNDLLGNGPAAVKSTATLSDSKLESILSNYRPEGEKPTPENHVSRYHRGVHPGY